MVQNLLHYTVTVNSPGPLAPPGDGFIDNSLASSYILPGVGNAYDMQIGWAPNYVDSLAKARGNLRWKTLIEQLSINVNPYSVQNITATGATSALSGTSMVFTLVYDRPDYLYAYDELNPGLMLYNEHAIRRWVSRALTTTLNVDVYPVLDPTAFTDPNFHFGERMESLHVGSVAANIPAAEALTTVVFEDAASGSTTYPIT